jgi:hypothetical protein
LPFRQRAAEANASRDMAAVIDEPLRRRLTGAARSAATLQR